MANWTALAGENLLAAQGKVIEPVGPVVARTGQSVLFPIGGRPDFDANTVKFHGTAHTSS
jgi:hypothetical protein